MSTIITEINSIKELAKSRNIDLTDDQAFNYLTLQYLCIKEKNTDTQWYEMDNCLTDGSNDGGIDYVYFDEEENKLIIGQNKYSKNIGINDYVAEINKIMNTLEDFKNGHTGSYNKKTKQILQNGLDRLTDETDGNIDIYFSSLSSFNLEKAMKKTELLENKINSIKIFDIEEIDDIITKINSSVEVVKEDKIEIDSPNHFVEYSSPTQEGIFVNVSSKSVAKLYNKYNTKGLFNLNIRKYIKNKAVDQGITESLNKNRQDFWFLNNGITIACSGFDIDGNTVKLYDFSIVNGGQTTTLIGTYKGSNDEEFYIPCKIISSKDDLNDEQSMIFFNSIAEATNSQKPIMPKDLKANAPEMIALKRLLKSRGIDFEIKRGELIKRNSLKIKNDEFAQLVYSFINQKPGTARSNKKILFESNKVYSTIFKKNYTKDQNKQDFIVDLIELNNRYDTIIKRVKLNMSVHFDQNASVVLNNGKTTIFALFGVIYRIFNDDITIAEINTDPGILTTNEFVYGSFISNYTEDDIDEQLLDLIKFLVDIINDLYQDQYENGKVTSVSNFFKTDKKYIDETLNKFISKISRKSNLEELKEYSKIFKRTF